MRKYEDCLFYISLLINDDYVIGSFIYAWTPGIAERYAIEFVSKKLNLDAQNIKLKYIKNLSSFSLIDICNKILKIDSKYTLFLQNRFLIKEVFHETLAQDIKKLILPGNYYKKKELVSQKNGYIELIIDPSIEIQNLITDPRYIRFVKNPSFDLLCSAISKYGAMFMVRKIDIFQEYQDALFIKFQNQLHEEYRYKFDKGYNNSAYYDLSEILLSKLSIEYKIFAFKYFHNVDFASIINGSTTKSM